METTDQASRTGDLRASSAGAESDAGAGEGAKHPRRASLVPALVGLLLVAPSLVWVWIDRSIWAWDQSYYANASINLWATLRLTPHAWWEAMTHVLGFWPPAIAWFGQFFVPLGGVLGSDQAALLFSTNAALIVALALLYTAGVRLTDGRRLPALVGALAAGGAPLLFNLSHWYLVEPIQILAVVWVLFIMVSARRWHISLTVMQLGAAVAFGLLTKLSTPAYVAAPAAVAVLLSFWATKTQARRRWWLDRSFLVSALLMLGLAWAALAWYRVNFSLALDHAKLAATSTFWGQEGSFETQLRFWLVQLRNALFVPYVGLFVVALLLVAVVLIGQGRARLQPSRYHILVLVGCLGVPASAVLLLANQINTDTRFMVPAVPAAALALVAALRVLDHVRVTQAFVVLFACQFGLMTLQSFATSVPQSLIRPAYHSVPDSSGTFADNIDRLVRTACAHSPDAGYNTVGTSYAWLNVNTLNMLSAKEVALDGRSCNWAGAAFTPTDPSGWQDITARNSPFILTVDYGNPRNPLPPSFRTSAGLGSALDRQINGGNAKLLRAALRSDSYEVVPGSRRLGLVLLRRVPTG